MRLWYGWSCSSPPGQNTQPKCTPPSFKIRLKVVGHRSRQTDLERRPRWPRPDGREGRPPEAATRWGWFGPRPGFRLFGQPNRIPGPSRPFPGIDLRGHRHIPGHLLIITDACRHGDVACELRDQPVFCGLTGRNFTQELQKPARGRESKGGHGPPLDSLPLE